MTALFCFCHGVHACFHGYRKKAEEAEIYQSLKQAKLLQQKLDDEKKQAEEENKRKLKQIKVNETNRKEENKENLQVVKKKEEAATKMSSVMAMWKKKEEESSQPLTANRNSLKASENVRNATENKKTIKFFEELEKKKKNHSYRNENKKEIQEKASWKKGL